MSLNGTTQSGKLPQAFRGVAWCLILFFTKTKYDMLGNLTIPEMHELLDKQSLGRLGCQADGKVYVVPITFAFHGKYLYAHSPEGQKIKMMRRNPQVCFEVDEMQDLANWRSVIVQGKFEELLGEPAREALDIFMKKMEPQLHGQASLPSHGIAHFHQVEKSSFRSVFFRIKILEMSGKFERSVPLRKR